MQDRVTYEFSIIRLVPKVEREEFINIGVLVFSKRKKYLGIKYQIDEARIKSFASEVDIDTVRSYLEAWECICTGAPHGGTIGALELPSRFRWLTASKSTIIQCSKPHPGLCHQPEQVIERIFKNYVL